MVERGPRPGSLVAALLAQATGLGVEVRFNSRMQHLQGPAIFATGPKAADAIAVGYHFDTRMPDGFWAICDNDLAPQGYAYLLVMDGSGTVKNCMFTGFKQKALYVRRTVEAFQRLVGLDMIEPGPHGGVGNFRRPVSARSGTHPVVGEQAGFQDTLWGFGMRAAINSGVLAARSVLDGSDYEARWRHELGGLLTTSSVNRALYSLLGNRGHLSGKRLGAHSRERGGEGSHLGLYRHHLSPGLIRIRVDFCNLGLRPSFRPGFGAFVVRAAASPPCRADSVQGGGYDRVCPGSAQTLLLLGGGCHDWEVLCHCTDLEIQRNYVDSHGQSPVAFAFAYLLGFELMPRLKGIGSQKLHRPETGRPADYPSLQPILDRPIDWKTIRRQYDEMVKYATALRLGPAKPEDILHRVARSDLQNPIYRALDELVRAVKTRRYLHDEGLRREVHEGLNLVENWNSANGFIFYSKGGEIATNRNDEQEAALALHLPRPASASDTAGRQQPARSCRSTCACRVTAQRALRPPISVGRPTGSLPGGDARGRLMHDRLVPTPDAGTYASRLAASPRTNRQP